MAAWAAMVQEKVEGLQVSQAGGGPLVEYKADVFSRLFRLAAVQPAEQSAPGL